MPFLKELIEYNYCCSYTHSYETIYWAMGILSGTILPKKTDSIPYYNQLLIAPQLGTGLGSLSLIHVRIFRSISYSGIWVDKQRCYESMCTTAMSVPENSTLQLAFPTPGPHPFSILFCSVL